MAKTDLEERCETFALAIIDLVEQLPGNGASVVVGQQLL
jgi:hypothetical protein